MDKYFFSLLLFLLVSCNYNNAEMVVLDCTEPYFYDGEVKQIINATCAYSGCHIPGSNAPGDFRTYEGMRSFLDNGQFEKRAILDRDMPPGDATGPTKLSEEEINILRCWMEEGFPK